MDRFWRTDFGTCRVWRWQGFLAALLVAGCTAMAANAGPGDVVDTAQEERMNETIVTRADHGRTVDMRIGDKLIVRLEEKPMTGFTWAVSATDERLVLRDSDYAPSGAVGGGGFRTLIFRAEKAGTGSVQLKLWQEWAGDSSVIDVFAVNARINVP